MNERELKDKLNAVEYNAATKYTMGDVAEEQMMIAKNAIVSAFAHKDKLLRKAIGLLDDSCSILFEDQSCEEKCTEIRDLIERIRKELEDK